MSAHFGQQANGFPFKQPAKPSLNAGVNNPSVAQPFASVAFGMAGGMNGAKAASQFAQPGQTFVSSAAKTTLTAGKKPGAGVSGKSNRAGQPQFGGMGYSLLGKALFMAPVISSFAALDQPFSMLAVAFRDFFDSTGRIFQEWKRDKHGGRESFIEELGTTLVWGFGIGLCKSAYDGIIPKLNKNILLPNIDLDLLPKVEKNGVAQGEKSVVAGKPGVFSGLKAVANRGIDQWDAFAQKPGVHYVFGTIRDRAPEGALPAPDSTKIQQLNAKAIKAHYGQLTDKSVRLEAPKGMWQKALGKFSTPGNFEQQSKHLISLIEDTARQSHIERYMGSNLGKLFLCTTLPVLAIGFGIPTFNQWLTRKLITKEKVQQWQDALRAAQKKLQPTAIQKKVGGAFSGFENSIAPLLPGIMAPAATGTATTGAAASASANNAAATGPAAALHSVAAGLGGNASFGAYPSSGAGFALANSANAMAGQAPMGAPSASAGHPKFGGILSALSPVTSFFLSHENLNTMTFVDFPLSSSRVYKSRNSDERVERAFREAMLIVVLFYLQRAIQTRINKVFNTKLGANTQIDAKALYKLHSSFVAGNESFSTTFGKLKNTLTLVKNSATDPKEEARLVEDLRHYFSPQRAAGHSNLLYDLAETSGHLHTMGAAGRKYVATGNNSHIIDITRKIDTAGIRELAQYLEHLQGVQTAASESLAKELLAKELVRNTGMKMGAFALSAMACWGIVSWLVPKVQHWITYKRTGRDFFPGIQNA